MKNKDNIEATGHLEIWKIYSNGEEELFFDEDNTITSGMGVGLGLLYAGSGATNITDYQIRYFQAGVGGDTVLTSYDITQFTLVSALGQVSGGIDYSGTQSPVVVDSHQLMNWNGQPKATEGTGAYGDIWFFGRLPDSAIKRVDLNSVTYIIYLDINTCNGHILNEVGMFMQNPLGMNPKRSNMVAYRPFTNITKTNDFSLVFKWTLNF